MRRTIRAALWAGLLLVLLAGANTSVGLLAEHEHPPLGRFLELSGVTLHYVEAGPAQTAPDGSGPKEARQGAAPQPDAVVLLHGNGAMVEDMISSGLMAQLAKQTRVIAFDRPGFGHSTRPGAMHWTPAAQAALLRAALAQLGVRRGIVVGHSWGALVAATLALQDPQLVSGLVLISGYFYPDDRIDVRFAGLAAVPGVNAAANYTLVPPLSHLTWPLVMDEVFGPERVPEKFAAFPRAMALRPWQLEAATEEVAMLPEATAANAARYGDLAMPVSIVVGTADRLIAPRHSRQLHAQIRQSRLHEVEGGGHMIHQTATPEILRAIAEVRAAGTPSP